MSENFLAIINLFGSTRESRNIVRLDLHEGAMLFRYAASIKEGNIVEIGRMHGGSTVILATATHGSKSKIISIDLEDNMLEPTKRFFKEYLEKERIDIRIDDSWKMKSIDSSMLFIYGDHSYDGVKKDFIAHWNGLKDNGLCLAHDYECPHCPGVTKFINEWVSDGYAKILEQTQTMVSLQKLKMYK